MKKVVFVFIAIITLILSALLIKNCFDKNKDAIKFKQEYEELNGKRSSSGKEYPKLEIAKNNPMKYKTEEELVEILEKGTGIIYFGFPTCPWCRSALPSLLEAADSFGVKNIYYLNVKDIRDVKKVSDDGSITLEKSGTEGYNKLLKILDKYLDDYIIEDSNGNKVNTKEKRIYVPLVVFVKDGTIIGVHSDTVDTQEDPYLGLDEKQTEELTIIYYKLMNKIGDDVCDENC